MSASKKKINKTYLVIFSLLIIILLFYYYKNQDEKNTYFILKRRVIKVYPYAITASKKLNEIIKDHLINMNLMYLFLKKEMFLQDGELKS